MVFPNAVDQKIFFGKSFFLEPYFFEDAATSFISGHVVSFDAMEPEFVDNPGDRGFESLNHESFPLCILRQAVPQRACVPWMTVDIRKIGNSD